MANKHHDFRQGPFLLASPLWETRVSNKEKKKKPEAVFLVVCNPSMNEL
jgi:hypothetical protein